MHRRSVRGEESINVRVDQKVIIETVNGIVEWRVVQSDCDESGEGSIVRQDRGDTTGYTSADLLLGIAVRKLFPALVPDEDPDACAGLGAGLQGRDPVGVFFGEEQAGEREVVDVPVSLTEQLRPQMPGDVATARPRRNQLGA